MEKEHESGEKIPSLSKIKRNEITHELSFVSKK